MEALAWLCCGQEQWSVMIDEAILQRNGFGPKKKTLAEVRVTMVIISTVPNDINLKRCAILALKYIEDSCGLFFTIFFWVVLSIHSAVTSHLIDWSCCDPKWKGVWHSWFKAYSCLEFRLIPSCGFGIWQDIDSLHLFWLSITLQWIQCSYAAWKSWKFDLKIFQVWVYIEKRVWTGICISRLHFLSHSLNISLHNLDLTFFHLPSLLPSVFASILPGSIFFSSAWFCFSFCVFWFFLKVLFLYIYKNIRTLRIGKKYI